MTDQRYRPDLCDSQSDDGEPQADLCGGDETQDELTRLRADRDLFRGQRDAARKQVSELNAKLQKCREDIDRAKRAHKSFWGDLDRLKAENERLRKEGSVYNGRSAEEWYTLYCQSVLASAAADTRHGDVMRDELPEYLL